ncbi:60S acidic ribosomal protein P2 isoform X1 [Photinus pyralis]|uniref:60S acidic ribosomal protein P2 isoform X1 n=1 Tax=Photinus pyralis TaxID=7054 RepID=UPI0012675D55|nr:60S acidic ribosomal protein P2 isoform X1 [Photinus pyralis]
MRYVAAYLLSVLGGKAAPAAGDIEKILSSVGIEADADKVKKVISELNGKSIDQVMAEGREKLSAMPSAGAAPAAAAAGAAPAAAAEDKKGKFPVCGRKERVLTVFVTEAKKEEKKKEESESEDEDMGFGLFD